MFAMLTYADAWGKCVGGGGGGGGVGGWREKHLVVSSVNYKYKSYCFGCFL